MGLLVLIPILFWTLSGIMHPFMSHWFKPKIANETFNAPAIAFQEIAISLPDALKQNNIEAIANARLTHLGKELCYQVKLPDNTYRFLSAQTGLTVENGVAKYAEQMARHYLNDKSSKILENEPVTQFGEGYKIVNRYLPAQKVSFDRPDAMDVYIDMEQGRLATFNNNARKLFIWVFDTFHNFSFITSASNNYLRIVLMGILLALMAFSTLGGLVIYGLMWQTFKQQKNNNTGSPLRRFHRQIGLACAFVTLCFTVSGFWHLLKKWTPDNRLDFVSVNSFKTSELPSRFNDFGIDSSRFLNFGLVKYQQKPHLQVFLKTTKGAEMAYFDLETKALLANGNTLYAQELAKNFANSPNEIGNQNLTKTTLVTKFIKEYGFVNKRLPVVQLEYNTPQKNTYYIETSTGRLAASINNSDRVEGFIFGYFHKFGGLDFLGKNVRDGMAVFSALGVLLVSMLGFVMLLKRLRRA